MRLEEIEMLAERLAEAITKEDILDALIVTNNTASAVAFLTAKVIDAIVPQQEAAH